MVESNYNDGKIEGIEENKIATVEKLKQLGMTVELIQQVTQLGLEQIKTL